MSRKRFKISGAALGAVIAFHLAGADTPGAFAQVIDVEQVAAEVTDEPNVEDQNIVAEEAVAGEPVFVSREVVQEVPAEAAPAQVERASSLRQLVAQHPRVGDIEGEMKCLAGAVYFEARGEPLAGQLAVARVVINRTAIAVLSISARNSLSCVVARCRGLNMVRLHGSVPRRSPRSHTPRRGKAKRRTRSTSMPTT